MKSSLQNLFARLTARLGQPSLEYIAIAVVLVVLVIVAFNFLGGQINTKSSTIGSEINAPTGGCPANQTWNPSTGQCQ